MIFIYHLQNILPSSPLEQPGFVLLVWQSLQMCSCFMIPGNFTLFRSLPVKSFIYFNLAIPYTSCLDFSSWSLSINKDFIMLLVAPVCIFSSFSTSSTADFLLTKEMFLDKWLKFVFTKLFLVLHESFIVAETMVIYVYTFIKLFVAA